MFSLEDSHGSAILIFMAKIHQSERIQSKISRGKPGPGADLSSNTGHNSSSDDMQEDDRDSAPRIFTGDRSHRHPLPSLPPNCRLPEGKQLLSRTDLGCTHTGTESPLRVRGLLEATFPGANLGSGPFKR